MCVVYRLAWHIKNKLIVEGMFLNNCDLVILSNINYII